jgi:predicted ATPase
MAAFRETGTAEDWLWKGKDRSIEAEIEIISEYPVGSGSPIRYYLSFEVVDFRLRISGEALTGEGYYSDRDALKEEEGLNTQPQQSFLSEIKDAINFPELTYVGNALGDMRLFRGWPRGRGNSLRKAQDVNLPSDFLLEDGSNLGLILNDLQNLRETKRLLLEKLRLVYEGIEDVTTKVQGGGIQIYFHEESLATPVPAARLSDGTLHYLCLLTVLLHPDPPPLICIEEPELGLHPDIIPKIAELLLDASKRTQLIVTTHSETLVSALSEVPEAIVVCERDDRGTNLRRLEPAKLKEWLERYSLGELWAKGEIGGNRW